jgi:hypothetical protein
MFKHYLITNENNIVIDGYSTAFKKSNENDFLLQETQERHFNFILYNNGVPIYKILNNQLLTIIDGDLPKDEPDTPTELERIEALEKALLEVILNG